MKRFSYSLILISLLILCSSCQKDGVYKPEKKLSKTTTIVEGIIEGQPINENEDEMTFYWEGKKLTRIDYYSNTIYAYTVTYNYDNKGRVTSIKESNYDEECVFTYKNGLTSEISLYRGDFEMVKLAIEHEGKKISKIHQEIYENDAFAAKSALNPLALIIDRNIADKIYKDIKADYQTSSKGIRVAYDILFSWENNNVSNIAVASTDNSYKINISFEYDNCKNPFSGLSIFNSTELGPDFISAKSENNIISYQYASDDMIWATNYQYTYEGKYPIERLEKVIDGTDYLTYTTKYIYL